MLSCLCVQVSAAIMAQPQGHFGYEIIRIIKTSSLGVGSYGAVYRALCDELQCAAKIIHPTLFDKHDPGAQKIMDRFEQECQFLSSIRHPNIVQYLGVSRDPESGLPVLLMELMDSSLTHFLERSKEPLLYHIQVDLCHDVALALAYLHKNGIIHRDLSSNNVLLIGPGNRAKVTDFGMSKLSSHMTPMTMCPGTQAYMPPEALKEPPVYSSKLDCFSFGVLGVQVMTRHFPNPSLRFRTIEINDPRIPSGTVDVPVPEVERRHSHIDLIEPVHPLLPVVLDCLKDMDRERSSAQELCHHLAALKEASQYGESVQQAQDATTDGKSAQIRELQAEARERQREMEQLQELQQEHIQQIENLQIQVQENSNTIENNKRQLQEKNHTVARRERQLRDLKQQLEANKKEIVDLQHKHLGSTRTIEDLRQILVAKNKQIRELQQQTYNQPTANHQVRCQSTSKGRLLLNWKTAPHWMVRPSSVVVDGNVAYFNPDGVYAVYSYDSEKEMWSTLPPCPHTCSSLAVVNGLLTAVGGLLTSYNQAYVSDQLLGLTHEGKWEKHFLPMPTKRYGTAVVCSEKSLIVAGGTGEDTRDLDTVDVMDTDTLQWSTACSLPFALRYASVTICQDRIYLLGHDTTNEPRSVLACSVADLLQSSLGARLRKLTQQAVWHRVADLPVRSSSCATLCGQLLAVGGSSETQRTGKPCTAIHQYDPANYSWNIISHMCTARSHSLVAVLPGNKLMVVGGYTQDGDETDIVEIATLQE